MSKVMNPEVVIRVRATDESNETAGMILDYHDGEGIKQESYLVLASPAIEEGWSKVTVYSEAGKYIYGFHFEGSHLDFEAIRDQAVANLPA